jgi:uncharacterized protein
MTETVVITGASSGIGAELARVAAREGCRLVLAARSVAALDKLAVELKAMYGVECHVFGVDLAEVTGPRDLVRFCTERGLEPDVLVNNAGFGGWGAFASLDPDRELAMIDVNVAALTHLCRLLLPGMLERRRGRILNVASTAAFQPGPFMAVYYATKSYVLSFSEALAEELRGTGVTVTALCPGPTSTGFGRAAGFPGTNLFKLLRPAEAAPVAAAGWRAMRRGTRIVIPGFTNALGAFLPRLMPRGIVTRVVMRAQGQRGS